MIEKLKKFYNGILNFIVKYLIAVRKCRKFYKIGLEKGVIEKDTLLNKSIFYLAFYFNILWGYFLLYILLNFCLQFAYGYEEICIDEYSNDFYNRVLFVINGSLTMTFGLLIYIKIIDFIYIIYKGIKNLIIKKTKKNETHKIS